MAIKLRISLATINALTDNDPRNYSLFADTDNVLIKEHSRGSEQVDDPGSLTVNHALGYAPHFYTYAETGTDGRFRIVAGYNIYGEFRSHADTDELVVVNVSLNDDREVRYFIFYDNIE